jgi:hypothetical protein
MADNLRGIWKAVSMGQRGDDTPSSTIKGS